VRKSRSCRWELGSVVVDEDPSELNRKHPRQSLSLNASYRPSACGRLNTRNANQLRGRPLLCARHQRQEHKTCPPGAYGDPLALLNSPLAEGCGATVARKQRHGHQAGHDAIAVISASKKCTGAFTCGACHVAAIGEALSARLRSRADSSWERMAHGGVDQHSAYLRAFESVDAISLDHVILFPKR